jgi:hypothetical protein
MKEIIIRGASDAYDSENCKTLKDIQIFAEPNQLRLIGEFFLREAKKLEQPGYDHAHWQDDWDGWQRGKHPDIVIYPREPYSGEVLK